MIRIANLLSAELGELAGALRPPLETALEEPAELDPSADVAAFRDGRVGIALICGLAYSMIHDACPGRFTAVAAPVVDDERHSGAAVYFSDVVVPAHAPAHCLDDLAGRRFAYNEAVSFSGYRALEHELLARGRSWGFFSACLRTGSHGASLAAVLEGRADAAAIDSHVLLLAMRRSPELGARLRVVEALGPYPAPPVAVNARACGIGPEQLNRLLARLPPELLHRAAIRRWQPVDNAYYDPLRTVTRDLPGLHL